jgi:hypothetical protein
MKQKGEEDRRRRNKRDNKLLRFGGKGMRLEANVVANGQADDRRAGNGRLDKLAPKCTQRTGLGGSCGNPVGGQTYLHQYVDLSMFPTATFQRPPFCN